MAKGDALPKPPAEPKPPVLRSVGPTDPKLPDALTELPLNVENGDFSEPEKAERPDDANAEVEVVGISVDCSTGFPDDEPDARGDFDRENAAKGEADAVFAKPELSLT